MEIAIKGNPKEIADLVVALQNRQINVVNHYPASKTDRNLIYDLTQQSLQQLHHHKKQQVDL